MLLPSAFSVWWKAQVSTCSTALLQCCRDMFLGLWWSCPGFGGSSSSWASPKPWEPLGLLWVLQNCSCWGEISSETKLQHFSHHGFALLWGKGIENTGYDWRNCIQISVCGLVWFNLGFFVCFGFIQLNSVCCIPFFFLKDTKTQQNYLQKPSEYTKTEDMFVVHKNYSYLNGRLFNTNKSPAD